MWTNQGQGDSVLGKNPNQIQSVQLILVKRLPIMYKEYLITIHPEVNRVELIGGTCPSRWAIRRAALSGIDAGASLPGISAQDR